MYSKRIALPHSEKKPVAGARLTGAPHPDETIEVTVEVRSRSAGQGAPDLASIQKNGRAYLTREAFAEAHGADPQDLEQVEDFAREHHLTIMDASVAMRTVKLAGTVKDMSTAFGVHLANYEHAGQTFRGREGTIQVPAELEGMVLGVFGLDDRPQARPKLRIRPEAAAASPRAGAAFSPVTVGQLYNFPTAGNGTGQTIAIIELGGGYRLSDLKTYFKRLGLKTIPKVTAIGVDGGKNQPDGNPNGPDGEVMLDIEVCGAVAPGAHIVVYFAPNTDRGFLDAIKTAAHDARNRPSVISISWGSSESNWTAQSMTAFDQAFQDAAAMGVSVFVAAGDNGSSDGVGDNLAHVDFPASAPHATGCGGTSLQGSGGTITSETVWNDGAMGGATGGGISDFFPLPSFQAGAGVPTSINPNPPQSPGRGVPDVAGDADPNTGYNVLVDGQWLAIGGTSAVAPLWAGLTALVNQQLGKMVGPLNSQIYNATGGFRDITVGNNGGYSAKKGWDACTGLGSPDGAKLLALL